MVFVAMGKDETANHAGVLLEVGEVGGDDVDAQELRFGKHHARINDDDVVTVPEHHGVHSELAQTPDGDYLELSIGHVESSTSTTAIVVSLEKGDSAMHKRVLIPYRHAKKVKRYEDAARA